MKAVGWRRVGRLANLRTGARSLLAASLVAQSSGSTASVQPGGAREEKLRLLRELMTKERIDAFIVPTDDPHMSEYTAPYYGRREFISGFTGSAGTALVLLNKALLFTDGRYHNQAELELRGSPWTVMKQGLKDVPTITDYLTTALPEGAVIGFDPFLHAAAPLKKMQELLESKKLIMKPLAFNLIDHIWESRPAAPQGKVRIHPLEFSGKTVQQKLEDIRKSLKSSRAIALVLTSLDDIAWTFNIRGADVYCNPVSVAYAIVGSTKAELFIDSSKVPTDVSVALQGAGVTLRPYEEALNAIGSLDLAAAQTDTHVWIDARAANVAVFNSVDSSRRIDKECPVIVMKACKNEAELAGMRACHLRDGAAMAEFFAWLEEELDSGKTISEVELDEKVCDFRASFGRWLEPSFPTIAGVGGNGAIVHYRASREGCKFLTNDDMCLLDSGGQYLDGTTDVTRTFHTGVPTPHQMEMFTRVLKGHIGLDSRVFPVGTAGCFLDSYAREHLWAIGKDYIHGTGHGVGAALNVHEGPHRISRVLDAHPLLVGNIVSNEPGYYEESNFGIRIENLLVVVPRTDLPEFGGRPFLGFERLTHIPIQRKLMFTGLLAENEITWINTYHAQVRERVFPLLKTDRARKWLTEATKPISSSL